MEHDDTKSDQTPVAAGRDTEAEAEPDPAPVEGTPPTAEELLSDLELQLAAERENALRAIADLQNFRRRAAEERVQQLQFANEQLIAAVLPVLDNFGRATECQVEGEAAQNLHRGVCMIRDQLYQVLASFGVQQGVNLGQMFDPALHEAVERVETTEVCEGTVVEEVLPGYTLNGRVIRPARVKVAVAPRE
jgi:molecular chaperone GrpE